METSELVKEVTETLIQRNNINVFFSLFADPSGYQVPKL
jgi:hypothetical protein